MIVFGLEEIEDSSEAREDHLLKEKIVDFSRETLQVGLSGSDIAEARRLGKKKAAIGDAEEAGRTPPHATPRIRQIHVNEGTKRVHLRSKPPEGKVPRSLAHRWQGAESV